MTWIAGCWVIRCGPECGREEGLYHRRIGDSASGYSSDIGHAGVWTETQARRIAGHRDTVHSLAEVLVDAPPRSVCGLMLSQLSLAEVLVDAPPRQLPQLDQSTSVSEARSGLPDAEPEEARQDPMRPTRLPMRPTRLIELLRTLEARAEEASEGLDGVDDDNLTNWIEPIFQVVDAIRSITHPTVDA